MVHLHSARTLLETDTDRVNPDGKQDLLPWRSSWEVMGSVHSVGRYPEVSASAAVSLGDPETLAEEIPGSRKISQSSDILKWARLSSQPKAQM